MLRVIDSEPEPIIEDVDGFIDELLNGIDDETDPLNRKLARVVRRAYDGDLLRFASDLGAVVESCGCDCETQFTCSRVTRKVEQWANRMLGAKTKHSSLRRVH